jgi:cation transport regulator ChaC
VGANKIPAPRRRGVNSAERGLTYITKEDQMVSVYLNIPLAFMVCGIELGYPGCSEGQTVPSNAVDTVAEGKVSAQKITSADVIRTAGFPASVGDALVAELKTVSGNGYDYPWRGLEADISSQPERYIQLLGYGSLLSQQSAGKTIASDSVISSEPVLAMGARRVFNYAMPEVVLKRYGTAQNDEARAALNVEYSKSENALLNGRVFRLYEKDVQRLREREAGYDLRPVVCVLWNQAEKKPFKAYVLACAHREWEGRPLVDDRLLPQPDYYILCRNGAESVSGIFLKVYLQTTFIPKTGQSLDEWEKLHPVGDAGR